MKRNSISFCLYYPPAHRITCFGHRGRLRAQGNGIGFILLLYVLLDLLDMALEFKSI